MSFFQNLGKKVGEAAQGVKSKTDELAAVAKLNKSINDEKRKMQQAYTNLGEKVFQDFMENESTDEKFTEDCETIKSAQESIKTFEEQILEVKNLKKCTGCGAELSRDVKFCPKCGQKQEEAPPQKNDNVEKEQEEQEKTVRTCPSCGAEAPTDSAFCIGCGTKLID